ncbi:reverse transcriptase domain-containing protein [Prevotella sp.]|uniref:reverse transcriptase domain-containing protein n=1 Tax=Prevotella sp. TaxID=59823 RepID=UPI004029DE64
MHREGYIMQEITSYGNMSEAFDRVLRGKKRKKCRQGRYLLAHREEVIAELTAKLADGSFRLGSYHERIICENGKVRHLQILSMYDRIAVYAVMNVVDQYLHKRYIRTTGASIKKRGTHDLRKCMQLDMDNDPEGTRYCYKFDVKHFYDNTKPEFVMWCFRRVFKDKTLLSLLDHFLHLLPEGISFGLRSSQASGNLLLSVFLDHFLKDKYGIKYFYRYCDDGVVLCGHKQKNWLARNIVHEQIGEIDLEIKKNERVFPSAQGIDFLGYVTFNGSYSLLRKRVKKKYARKLHKVKSRKRRRELIASFYGMAKHACCRNLFYKLTGKKMKSFKDLNVAYKPEDGKKRFAGAVVSIRELVNIPIIVKDFETGIKTEQGEDRCIVSIEMNGEARKFFTNSEEMKNILAQIKEVPDGFTFETTIKTEVFGKGRTKYVFS